MFLLWAGNWVRKYCRDEFHSTIDYSLSSVLLLRQQPDTRLPATSVHSRTLTTVHAYASQSTEQYRCSVSQLRYLPLPHPPLCSTPSRSVTHFLHSPWEWRWLTLFELHKVNANRHVPVAQEHFPILCKWSISYAYNNACDLTSQSNCSPARFVYGNRGFKFIPSLRLSVEYCRLSVDYCRLSPDPTGKNWNSTSDQATTTSSIIR